MNEEKALNGEQAKELLQQYDDLRELMFRMSADMNQVKSKYEALKKKGDQLDDKMSGIEARIENVARNATSKSSTKEQNKPAKPPKQTEAENTLNLKDFFKSRGLEVIDKRPSGGCLWITGDSDRMKQAVELAKTKYGVKGNYGHGRATKQRPGWFTDSDK